MFSDCWSSSVKWILLQGCHFTQRIFASALQYGIALFTAFLTAFYMFRLLFLTFHGSFRGTAEQQAHLHESPALMTIPLMILAILSVAGGWIGIPAVLLHDADWLGNFLAPLLGSATHEVSHATEWLLMSLSVGGVLITIGFAWFLYRNYAERESKGLLQFFENKWYVDELYDRIIVKPIFYLGRLLKDWVEPRFIDALVNGLVKRCSWQAVKSVSYRVDRLVVMCY